MKTKTKTMKPTQITVLGSGEAPTKHTLCLVLPHAIVGQEPGDEIPKPTAALMLALAGQGYEVEDFGQADDDCIEVWFVRPTRITKQSIKRAVKGTQRFIDDGGISLPHWNEE